MRWKKQKNIEIAHLFSSSFRKESGVQRMTVVCRHTYDPCSCAQRNLWGMCEADTVPTGQTCCTRVTLGDGRTQEMIHSYGKTFPLSPRHTHTCTRTRTHTNWSLLRQQPRWSEACNIPFAPKFTENWSSTWWFGMSNIRRSFKSTGPCQYSILDVKWLCLCRYKIKISK